LNTGYSLFFYKGPKGAENVAKLLGENFYITEIDISQNKTSSQGCEALCEALNENTTLKSLNLSWNELGNKGALNISDTLRCNHSLKKLDVSGNGFEEEAGRLFGKLDILVLRSPS
jgi:hypothetical protein